MGGPQPHYRALAHEADDIVGRRPSAILPPIVVSYWALPEGLRVLPDGAWRVGGFPILHLPSLRLLKAHLFFDEDGAFIADGAQRMPVVIEGPPFEVVSLVLDREREEVRAVLDDGTEERLDGGSLGMNEETGRFECRVRGGRARAVFSRAAHQVLLDNAVQEGRVFHLRIGGRRIPIAT